MTRNTRTHPDDGILERGFAITPSDGADLAVLGVFVHVGVSGDLKVTTAGGDTVTYTAVANGWFPVLVNRVWSNGTTATNLSAGY